KKVFELKGRPMANPLIIHLAHWEEIEEYALDFPPGFEPLAEAFWPGPLTLILPIDPERIDPLVRADLPTAGFRIPAHPLTLKVLQETGPLVMPSANLSGKPSSTQSEHVEHDFSADFPVLCGGSCTKGLESTILYYKEPFWGVVRMGSLAPSAFQPILGYEPLNLAAASESKPICPGQLFRHYAPQATLLLDPIEMHHAPCLIGFTERSYPQDKRLLLLGSIEDPEQVAAHLYQILRHLDSEGIAAAWVDMDFPREGLWASIAERLVRAAGLIR
ncbi:MAG: L-threonylcarbamoyladenylate synthase, partial [Chlamydiales bacterium]